MSISKLIYDWFTRFDYRWKIDGTRQVPTQQQIKDVLDKALASLYDEPVGAQLEVGRLIIQKSGSDRHDIFMYVGTMEEE